MKYLIGLCIVLSVQVAESGKISAKGLKQLTREAAAAYGVRARDLFAIMQVESSGRHEMLIRLNKNLTTDVGPYQVNTVHANTTCKEYNIYTFRGNAFCAAKLLAMHKRKASVDPCWRALYHSRTPHLKARYCNKLNRALLALK